MKIVSEARDKKIDIEDLDGSAKNVISALLKKIAGMGNNSEKKKKKPKGKKETDFLSELDEFL
jgi:hypothetical protein